MKINLEKIIKERIENNEIKMKPKVIFVLGSISMITGIIMSFVMSSFLVNVIRFRIRTAKLTEYLPMEQFGRRVFINNFPWMILAGAIFAFAIGALLLKKNDISYKKSFTLILITILVSIISSALVLDKVGVNKPIKRIDGLGEHLYQSNLDKNKWISGVLQGISENHIMIQPQTGPAKEIMYTKETWFPPRELNEGECVLVVVDKEEALGVRPCKPPHGKAQSFEPKPMRDHNDATKLPTR